MTRFFKKWFLNKSLGYKFNLVFILTTLLPILFIAYASYKVIDWRLIADTKERARIGLKTAWMTYYARGEQMRYGMLQASTEEDVRGAVKQHDGVLLREMMRKWKEKRPYVDIWIITDSNGNVISRLNSELRSDTIEINGLLKKALSTGKTLISTELLSEDMMNREGVEFHLLAAIPETARAVQPDTGMKDDMALVVITPVTDGQYRNIGAIITADVINNDPYLPDTVANRFPWLFTSLSLKGVRITTNLRDSNGQTANWTPIPAGVASKIRPGDTILDEWELQGQGLVSAYEPIVDNTGQVIGSLDVAIPKTQIWAIRAETAKSIAGAAVIGFALSLIISLITTRRIVRPLKLLKQKALDISTGTMEEIQEVDADKGSEDELNTLTHAFNTMVTRIREQNEEKEMHAGELREKNRDYLELNKRLGITNEKLELAYEETQTQTEELNAGNEELRVTNEELKNRIEELKAANKRIKEEEEKQQLLMEKLAQAEKLSALGEVVSGVAHELNNPLTTIMGFSELLLDKDLPEDIKKRLRMINEASQRSKQIIENLLIFGRSHKPEKGYHDINTTIISAIEIVKCLERVENVVIETDLDPAIPESLFDETQIQEVIINLISNAQQAIEEKEKYGRILIRSRIEGKALQVNISDTGIGIPDHLIKKIFDPFFTTKPVGKGTGLGLSISYGIIREHGGNIHVESKPGKGSTFTVELPVITMPEYAKADTTLQQIEGAAKPMPSGLRALVLDDEENILEFLKEALSGESLHVDTAATASKALKMATETPYDIIISDIKMQGMDGKEFYERLKDIKPEAADNLIFISGDTMSKDTQAFLESTGKPFLKKPFSTSDIKKAVERHISGYNRS